MRKQSIWSDLDILKATVRQIAIDNGTPNVMPTLVQLKDTPGLMSYVKNTGGVRHMSAKLNMVMKPNVLPEHGDTYKLKHKLQKGSTVFIHNCDNVVPAIVLGKGNVPGGLIVMSLGKKIVRRYVKYGITSSSVYQWCYSRDIPKEKINIVI